MSRSRFDLPGNSDEKTWKAAYRDLEEELDEAEKKAYDLENELNEKKEVIKDLVERLNKERETVADLKSRSEGTATQHEERIALLEQQLADKTADSESAVKVLETELAELRDYRENWASLMSQLERYKAALKNMEGLHDKLDTMEAELDRKIKETAELQRFESESRELRQKLNELMAEIDEKNAILESLKHGDLSMVELRTKLMVVTEQRNLMQAELDKFHQAKSEGQATTYDQRIGDTAAADAAVIIKLKERVAELEARVAESSREGESPPSEREMELAKTKEKLEAARRLRAMLQQQLDALRASDQSKEAQRLMELRERDQREYKAFRNLAFRVTSLKGVHNLTNISPVER